MKFKYLVQTWWAEADANGESFHVFRWPRVSGQLGEAVVVLCRRCCAHAYPPYRPSVMITAEVRGSECYGCKTAEAYRLARCASGYLQAGKIVYLRFVSESGHVLQNVYAICTFID